MEKKLDYTNLMLLIEGPISSEGKNFYSQTTHLKFDAFNRVMLNIKDFKKYSNKIVLVTKTYDLNKFQRELLVSQGVYLLEKYDSQPIKLKNSYPNNIFNQFRSVQKGVEYLYNSFGNGYIIKIRTDVTIDFNFLVDDINKINVLSNQFLLINFFINRKKSLFKKSKIEFIKKNISQYDFGMLDFIFVCESELLTAALKNAFMTKTLSPHRFLLHGLIDIDRKTLNLKVFDYLFDISQNKKIILLFVRLTYAVLVTYNERLFEKILYKKIFPMSSITVYSMEWRDSKYIDWSSNNNRFAYEFLEDFINENNINNKL
jgi:hypothetical protein